MNILLIAGHGNGDPGAIGNGYKEADCTREMAKLIQKALGKYECTANIADTSLNWRKYLNYNGNYYSFKPYDYVLEIHFNAGVKDKGNGKTTGTEIFVTKSEKNTVVEDFIVKGISDIGFKNRGVKRENWAVISYVKNQGVSAALLEACFIDDADDMKLYANRKNDIAKAVADGIAKGFKLKVREGANEMTKADVLKIIAEYEAEKAKASAGTWSNEAWKKAKAKGIMDGTQPQSPLTREQFAVILDRLKLL